MGFGTLFIGYFFLINISYFAYTDIIGAMVMLMGLYKLSSVNRQFKVGMYIAISFSVFSLAELVISFAEIFISNKFIYDILPPYLGAARYLMIFAISLTVLRGIAGVACEVDASELASAAKRNRYFTAIFIIASLLEIPFTADILGNASPYIYFAVLLAVIIFILMMLSVIYKAYMQICMPEDLVPKDKKSKFEFLNKFYDRIEEKGRKYAEYKLSASTEKSQKKKKKRKK